MVPSRAALAGVMSELSSPKSEPLRDLLELEAVELLSACDADWFEVLDTENEGPWGGLPRGEDDGG